MKNIIQSQKVLNYQESANNFIKALDKAEAGSRSTTKHKQKKSFAPSGLGYGSGRCPRYWHYAFKGAEFVQMFRATDVRNMDNGIDTHERFQRALDEYGFAASEDIEPVAELDDPPIFGYIDGIVEWDGKTWVIEFKTSRDKWFDYRKNSKAPSYHLIQILVYMYVKNIRQGMLIYENKETHQRCAIAVEWNDEHGEYIEKMFAWMRMVHRKITVDGVKPKRGFSKKSSECQSCPVAAVCWGDDEEGDEKLKNLSKPKS